MTDFLIDAGAYSVTGIPAAPENGEHDSPRVRELQCGTRRHAMEGRLHGGVRRGVIEDDALEGCVKCRETPGKGESWGKSDVPAGDKMRPIGGSTEDRPARAERAGIDSDDQGPGGRVHASSGTEASSNVRLA